MEYAVLNKGKQHFPCNSFGAESCIVGFGLNV